MITGFYHPSRGVWFPTHPPTSEMLGTYPVGTVSGVPHPPGSDHDYDAENNVWVHNPPPATRDDVNAERDRRLFLDFTYNGVAYDGDETSQSRIRDARISALSAILGGATPGDLRWHGQAVDFFWITKANAKTSMDAHTVVAFGNVIAARTGMLIAAADALKALDPIPADYATNESYWP
ncbi:hypothetical protein IWQ55_000290 [Labrenzia sp. EL_208]|nr:hypothetical protein [Labrenzia sp. EL_132]MBG6227098.1 hypothetical protein [Labrenzia sp. EL_208]